MTAEKLLFDPPASHKAEAVLNQPEKDFERQYQQPHSHRQDPLSSYRAGDRVLHSGKLKGQMKAVLDALRRHPNSTSAELAQLAGLDRYMVARRLPALAAKGLTIRSKERLCRACRSICVTWWAA
jgi:hypothetical protein